MSSWPCDDMDAADGLVPCESGSEREIEREKKKRKKEKAKKKKAERRETETADRELEDTEEASARDDEFFGVFSDIAFMQHAPTESPEACVIPSPQSMAEMVFGYKDPEIMNTPVNFENDIKEELDFTRLRCCIFNNTITADDMYKITKFRKRAEDTIFLRAILFVVYCEMSTSEVDQKLLEKHATPKEAEWDPSLSVSIPPIVLRMRRERGNVPKVGALALCMQLLVQLGKAIRVRATEHDDHTVLADAEMYFHHMDYTRTVVQDMRNHATLPEFTETCEDSILDRMETFLVKLMANLSLDAHNAELRKMWYENYCTPIDVELRQFDIGPGPDVRAQRVFAHTMREKMNEVNTALSAPLEKLVAKRTDLLRECCILVMFCTWVSNSTFGKVSPRFYTLHDARSANRWSIVFMFRRFFISAPNDTFVGPFTHAKSLLRCWTGLLAEFAESADERTLVTSIYSGSFDKEAAAGDVGGVKVNFFPERAPEEEGEGGEKVCTSGGEMKDS